MCQQNQLFSGHVKTKERRENQHVNSEQNYYHDYKTLGGIVNYTINHSWAICLPFSKEGQTFSYFTAPFNNTRLYYIILLLGWPVIVTLLVCSTPLSENTIHFQNKENKSACCRHISLPLTVTETSMLIAVPIVLLTIQL